MPPLPKRNRFSLPDALDHLRQALGYERVDLAQALKSGRLESYCYPYFLDREKKAVITAEQWTRDWPNDGEFPVYANHIGDLDIGEFGENFPLQIVPDEADHLLRFRDEKSGQKLVEAAEVYIDCKELARFVADIAIENMKTRDGIDSKRKKRGRKPGHDYTDIDRHLERYLKSHGKDGFSPPQLIISYLEDRIGENALPSKGALRNHVTRWLGRTKK